MADVVTNAGRTQAAGYLAGSTGGVAQVNTYYGAVGTGAGTAAVADTTLFTEVGTARVAISPTRTTTVIASDTAQYVFTYTATGTITITNAGVFTAITAGTLMQKSDHAGIPMLNTDTITYTFRNQQA